MEGRGWIGRHGFWPLALLWLPAGIVAQAVVRFGYRRGAWSAGVALGAAAVAVTVPAGLLGPLAIAVCAVAAGLPVWIAWWWLARRD